MNLPVIIGAGGINAAGRGSFHHAFNWLIYDQLNDRQKLETLVALTSLEQPLQKNDSGFVYDQEIFNERQIPKSLIAKLKQATFIRQLERSASASLQHNYSCCLLTDKNDKVAIKNTSLGQPVGVKLSDSYSGKNVVQLDANSKLYLGLNRNLAVNAGGQLPLGFDPGKLYKSANHPLGLKLTIYGVSDALYSMGLDWQRLSAGLSINQIGVYAASMLGNMDEFGASGYIKAAALGKKPSSKQMPLSMPQMAADFINSYVLGNLGPTQAAIGACATFLYNLSSAVSDIQNGKCRLAVVGAADAPLTPEIIEAYAAMRALATDRDLLELDKLPLDVTPDYRRACRPFGQNRGFVLGESAQFFILCDDQLALETGANILGAAGGVFINADGYKRSISKPGPGNLFSMAQACSLAEAIIGQEQLRRQTFVSAHGTGTPQNRVTESWLLNQTAKMFMIDDWPVCAVKSYVGHSTGAAAADQLNFLLGSFSSGIVPGIKTTNSLADDVASDRLNICLDHLELGADNIAGGFVNSKGFGGNNATAFILSPKKTLELLEKKHGSKKLTKFAISQENTLQLADNNDKLITEHRLKPIYNASLSFDETAAPELSDGFVVWNDKKASLTGKNPYLKE